MGRLRHGIAGERERALGGSAAEAGRDGCGFRGLVTEERGRGGGAGARGLVDGIRLDFGLTEGGAPSRRLLADHLCLDADCGEKGGRDRA